MTEFHAQLRDRAREALRRLVEAQVSGDDYAIDVHSGELDSIARTAEEHDLRVPELEAFRGWHAA